jgi:hypothetical protein
MLGVRRVQLALLRIVAAVLVHQVAHNGSTARQKGTLNLAWSMYVHSCVLFASSEDTGAMGREIESRQGIGCKVFREILAMLLCINWLNMRYLYVEKKSTSKRSTEVTTINNCV